MAYKETKMITRRYFMSAELRDKRGTLLQNAYRTASFKSFIPDPNKAFGIMKSEIEKGMDIGGDMVVLVTAFNRI